MKLDIGFVDDPRFNAWAASAGSWDVIGINSGVIFLLLAFYRSMLTHMDVYPGVVTPNVDQNIPFSYPVSVKNIPVFAYAAAADGKMSDPAREKLAQTLTLGSCQYIFLHELAHITNGHCDISPDSSEIKLVEVTNNSDIRSSSLTSQTLEWDADLSAANNILLQCLNPEIEMVDGQSRWHLRQETPFGTLEDGMAVPLVVLTVAHIFLTEADVAKNVDIASRSHPPAVNRFLYNLVHLLEMLRRRARMAHEDAMRMLHRDFGEITKGVAAVFPGRPALFRDAPDMDVHKQLLIDFENEWRRIHPALDECKRGGRIAGPEPADDPI